MNDVFKKPGFWLATAALVFLLGLALYFWNQNNKAVVVTSEPVTSAPSAPPPSAPAVVAPDNAVKYPLPESPMKLADKADADKDKVNKLPPPDDSDSLMNELIAGLIGSKPFAEFFQTSGMVRRLTAAIDNLPRDKVASRLNPLKPIAGALAITGADDSLALSAGNYSRYQTFVDFASGVDTRKIVDAYQRFYPLFQQEYRALGYPDKYFNDRVVEAIDDLLAAPTLTEPAKLMQPKVQYQFADPALESLSHGKKAMIRLGPENANRLKAKLREIRAAITSASGRPKT